MIGDWKDNKMEGDGKLEMSNGHISDGTWANSKLNGKGKITYASKENALCDQISLVNIYRI